MIELYWEIEKHITQKVETEKWGKSVVEDLSAYIKNNEVNSRGFSARNLWTMKQFYQKNQKYKETAITDGRIELDS